MKNIIKIIAVVLIFPSLMFALSDKQLAVSIDLAGKQRMLTQKMSKEMLLIKSNINKKENLKSLKKSSELFYKTLQGLIHGDRELRLTPTKNVSIQQQLKEVEKLWEPFHVNVKKVLSKSARKKDYKMIAKQNLELLKQMNKAVYMYAQRTPGATLDLALATDINLAGKQRMLTQRMAKDILMVKNKIDIKKHKNDLKESVNLFDKTLKGLLKGDKSLGLKGTKLTKITNQLKKVQRLWKKVKPSVRKLYSSKKTMKRLDDLLFEMNKAVKLYTKSLNKQKQGLQLASIVNGFMHKKSSLNHVINLSGKQRMLTQRISKLSILAATNVDVKNSKDKLIEYSKLYDRTLNGFVNGDKSFDLLPTKDKKILKYIEELKKEWKPFYLNIQALAKYPKKSKKPLSYIVKRNEKLLKMSDKLVQLFKDANKTRTFMDKVRANIVDVAGRQRMLTQKMTKEKLLIISKIDEKENKKKLKNTISVFDSSLNMLIKGNPQKKIATPTDKNIKEQLKKVSSIWSKLKPIYSSDKVGKKELSTIISQNPILLKEMDKVVKMSEIVADY